MFFQEQSRFLESGHDRLLWVVCSRVGTASCRDVLFGRETHDALRARR